MTSKKLSELPAGTVISNTDLFYTTQGLTSVSVTGAQLAAFAGGGTGDVVGPASATANGFAVYDGTTGKLIKNHAATVNLASEVSGNLAVTNLNSGTLASGTTFWRGDGTWAVPAGGGGGMAIGGSITSGTAGSVLFVGPGGVLAQNNTNFLWDDTNKALNISGERALFKKSHAFTDNWFVGAAGNFTLTGQGNVGVGDNALLNITTGTFNMAMGATALQRLTTGSQNTAIGGSALQFLVTGSGNVAIGANAMGDNDGSEASVAVGDNCFAGNQDFGNTGVGFEAGSDLQHFGAFNTMLGFKVGKVLPDNSEENTWIGTFQGTGGFTPISNTIIITDGENADSGNDVVDTGVDFHFTNSNIWSFTKRNTAIGMHLYKTIDFARPPVNYERAIFDWTTTSNTLTIGTQKGGTGTVRPIAWAGLSNKTTPIGADHLLMLDSTTSDTMKTVLVSALPSGGGGGMSIGGAVTGGTSGSVLYVDSGTNLAQDNANLTFNATTKQLNLNASDSGAGGYFTDGLPAIFRVPNGSGDNWFEDNAGNFAVTGSSNIGTGNLALASVSTGYRNLSFGAYSLTTCTTGFDNTAIGTLALLSLSSGYNNTAFGSFAMQNHQSGHDNFAFGYNSLNQLTDGNYNVAIGPYALYSAVHNTNNVAIGASALIRITAGNGNVGIGDNAAAGVGMVSVSDSVFIGKEAGFNLSGSALSTWIGGYKGIAAAANYTICLSTGEHPALDFNWMQFGVWSMHWPGEAMSLRLYKTYDNPDATVTNYERGMIDWRLTANVFRVATEAGGTGVKRLVAIDGFAKAGAPAAGDLPTDTFAVIDDTSAGQTWLCFNKAGTIRKVQLT